MTQITREEILNIIRRQKNAEIKKAKNDAFFRKSKEDHLRNEDRRRQQEIQRQQQAKLKPKRKPFSNLW